MPGTWEMAYCEQAEANEAAAVNILGQIPLEARCLEIMDQREAGADFPSCEANYRAGSNCGKSSMRSRPSQTGRNASTRRWRSRNFSRPSMRPPMSIRSTFGKSWMPMVPQTLTARKFLSPWCLVRTQSVTRSPSRLD